MAGDLCCDFQTWYIFSPCSRSILLPFTTRRSDRSNTKPINPRKTIPTTHTLSSASGLWRSSSSDPARLSGASRRPLGVELSARWLHSMYLSLDGAGEWRCVTLWGHLSSVLAPGDWSEEIVWLVMSPLLHAPGKVS